MFRYQLQHFINLSDKILGTQKYTYIRNLYPRDSSVGRAEDCSMKY